MSKISKSPERNTFQKGGYLQRKADEGKTPENCEEVKAMVDYYTSWSLRALEQESDPEWRENNMEYDLRSTDWILEKVRGSDVYAQNLYAAMCNNDFQKNEFMPLLAGRTWSCSWRSAGGVIADMREQGDYIDWYCSGIRGEPLTDEEFNLLTEEQQIGYKERAGFVGESVVTDEIRRDLRRLGWDVIPYTDE
jgi:hypothetical protein